MVLPLASDKIHSATRQQPIRVHNTNRGDNEERTFEIFVASSTFVLDKPKGDITRIALNLLCGEEAHLPSGFTVMCMYFRIFSVSVLLQTPSISACAMALAVLSSASKSTKRPFNIGIVHVVSQFNFSTFNVTTT